MLSQRKRQTVSHQSEPDSVSVEEATKLGNSLKALVGFVDDHDLHDELAYRASDLMQKNIVLFDTYVNSCRDSGKCDFSVLKDLLFQMENLLDTDRVSSDIRREKTQCVITLVNEFKKNLGKDNEGRFDALHNEVGRSISKAHNSYNSILTALNAVPQARISGNSLIQDKDSIWSESGSLWESGALPLVKTDVQLWLKVGKKLDEALSQGITEDTKRDTYTMNFRR